MIFNFFLFQGVKEEGGRRQRREMITRAGQRVNVDPKGFSKGFLTGKIQTKRFSKGCFTGEIQTKRFSKGFFTGEILTKRFSKDSRRGEDPVQTPPLPPPLGVYDTFP